MAHILHERDMKSSMAELKVQAVLTPHLEAVAVAPGLTTLDHLIMTVAIVAEISQMPYGTSQQRSSHMRQGSGKPQLYKCIMSLSLGAALGCSQMREPQPVQPVSRYLST